MDWDKWLDLARKQSEEWMENARVVSDTAEAAVEAPMMNNATEGWLQGKTSQDMLSMPRPIGPISEPGMNTEEYHAITENRYLNPLTTPLSTFSADVDTASYANLRDLLDMGYRIEDIPAGAVRTEEMINYFSYDYKTPAQGEPFGVNVAISECPWNQGTKLAVIGLQTQDIDFSDSADSNLVFLIDVSGSMYNNDKLPLLKKGFAMMLDKLGEKDKISVVTYASRDEVVLSGVPASRKEDILAAIGGLEAGGSTNGSAGIITAYQLAEKYFIEGGNNRVILATDGDLNVGLTNESDLKELITEMKDTGVFLSVLGFGRGNYSDARMETLADCGNGNYSYIDTEREAKKVLVEELGATLVTVAKDVKLQVEFNPAIVSEYRLVGYENRTMAAEDFEDDKKDAGEIGAGHSVTAMYEIRLKESEENLSKSLKYQDTYLTDAAKNSQEWMTLSIRYKEPEGDTSKLLSYPIGYSDYTEKPGEDFVFAAAVAEFSLILKDSEYAKHSTMEGILDRLRHMEFEDEYKEEFYDLVRVCKSRQ